MVDCCGCLQVRDKGKTREVVRVRESEAAERKKRKRKTQEMEQHQVTNKVKGVTPNAFGYARISKLGVEREETPAN